jgi:hypothetical protein
MIDAISFPTFPALHGLNGEAIRNDYWQARELIVGKELGRQSPGLMIACQPHRRHLAA